MGDSNAAEVKIKHTEGFCPKFKMLFEYRILSIKYFNTKIFYLTLIGTNDNSLNKFAKKLKDILKVSTVILYADKNTLFLIYIYWQK
jgi:hypothetical protein